MKVSHAAAAVDATFDDPNLIADAGLVPVLALAEQIGLPSWSPSMWRSRARSTVRGRTRRPR
jgi:hypothetical protein